MDNGSPWYKRGLASLLVDTEGSLSPSPRRSLYGATNENREQRGATTLAEIMSSPIPELSPRALNMATSARTIQASIKGWRARKEHSELAGRGRKRIRDLKKELVDSDWTVRRFACNQLAVRVKTMTEEEKTGVLTSLGARLQDDDIRVRSAAAVAASLCSRLSPTLFSALNLTLNLTLILILIHRGDCREGESEILRKRPLCAAAGSGVRLPARCRGSYRRDGSPSATGSTSTALSRRCSHSYRCDPGDGPVPPHRPDGDGSFAGSSHMRRGLCRAIGR